MSVFTLAGLVIVEAEHGGATEERIIHIDITGVVISVGVPQTPGAHPHSLPSLLSNDDLHHDLVSVVAQGLHLTLHVVSDGFGPLGDLVSVVHLPAQLLVQTAVDDLLKREDRS